MLDATDIIGTGEYIMASTYFYLGAGSGASDHNLTNAGGSKLYCVARPYVTPDQFGAPGRGNDETDEVLAAVGSGKPVFLNRYYDVTHVYFSPDQTNRIRIVGAGPARSGLYGISSSSLAVLMTFPTPSLETGGEGGQHYIANFGIQGTAVNGLAIPQTVTSTFDSIDLRGFNSNAPAGETSAVIMELSFSNVLRNIRTGYGNRTDLKLGATILNTTISNFIAENTRADQHIDIDPPFQEIAYGQAPGNGVNHFYSPILSGARGYAIKLSGHSSFNFHNPCITDCKGAFLVRSTQTVNIVNGILSSTESGHGTWLDSTEGNNVNTITIQGTQIEKPIVAGAVGIVTLDGTNYSVSDIKKTNATYQLFNPFGTGGSGAVQILGRGTYKANAGSVLTMKASNSGSGFSEISIDSSGNVSGTAAAALTDVAEYPHSPVPFHYASGTPFWQRNVAITPVQVTVRGGVAPYTYELVGDLKKAGPVPGVTIDSSGLISGTPTGIATFPDNTITDGLVYGFRIKVTDSSPIPFIAYGRTISVEYRTPAAAVQNGTIARTASLAASPYVFSTANGSLLTLSDFGYTTGNVTLTASHGTLTLSGTTGLTFQVGDGTNDTTMTFTGTLTNITTALANLAWAPGSTGSGRTVTFAATNENGTTTRTLPFTVNA